MSYLNNNTKLCSYKFYIFKNNSDNKIFTSIYKYLIGKNYKELDYYIKFLKKNKEDSSLNFFFLYSFAI